MSSNMVFIYLFFVLTSMHTLCVCVCVYTFAYMYTHPVVFSFLFLLLWDEFMWERSNTDSIYIRLLFTPPFLSELNVLGYILR